MVMVLSTVKVVDGKSARLNLLIGSMINDEKWILTDDNTANPEL